MATQQSNIGLRPTQAVTEDFGGIVQQGLSIYDAKRQRDEDEKEKKRKEFDEKFGIEEDLYVLPDTEFRSVNDATTEAMSKYRDRYYDVFKELQADPNNLELKKKLGNITNSVKRMRAAHDKFMTMGQQGLDMIANDSMSGVDEDTWREQLEAFDEGRIQIRLDDSDNMQFLFYDKEGGLAQVVPYNEFVRGDIYNKVDVESEIEGMLKLIGRDSYDENIGRFIRTVDEFGPRQEQQARALIRQQLESDEVVADILNQANGSKKRSDFTDQEKAEAEQYLVNTLRNAYDQANSLKERPLPRVSRPRTGSGGATDPISTDLIQPATDNGAPSITSDGKFLFTLGQGIAIDPTKSDRKIDRIEATADGNIVFRGEDREKVKDVPPSEKETQSAETVAAENNLSVDDMIEILNGDGSVTYYRRVPFVEDANSVINKVGNMFGVSDEDGLRDVLYNKFVEKFGKETADRYFSGDKQPQQAASPTQGMTPEQKIQYYKNLNK